jgi:hypothetical protein
MRCSRRRGSPSLFQAFAPGAADLISLGTQSKTEEQEDMSLFNITLLFSFSSLASDAHIRDNALRVSSALQDKPTEFRIDWIYPAPNLTLKFLNREFRNRFEALFWAKNIENIALDALKGGCLADDRTRVTISDSTGW